jgi:hypothetical protein
MTYISGGLIQATDYNGFVSTTAGANLNAVWNTAYGQPAVATVAAAATVTATQWATLNNNLAAAAAHQGTAITARTSPVVGNIINILAAMNTDLTNINTNRFNASASGAQFTGWTGSSSKTTPTGSGAAAWTITFTSTVTFASASQAQIFFNAGGLLKVQFSKTSTGTLADPEWNDLASTLCGAIFVSGTAAAKSIAGTSYTGTTKIGGTGAPSVLSTGTGYAQLSGAPTTLYTQFADTAPYTGQYISVSAAASGATVTFTTVWVDPGGAPVGSTDAISGGTATTGISFGTAPATVVTAIPPSTANLTNTWGAIAIASSVV